ncbi:MAG: Ig-like domain-containing protein, partial [Pseudobdellovibrionaceae bacterium]
MARLKVPFLKLNQSGFTPVELIMATAVMMMTVLAAASISSYIGQSIAIQNRSVALSEIQSGIMNVLLDKDAWTVNVNKAGSTHPSGGSVINPEMVCLKNGIVCPEGEFPLTVFKKSGDLWLDSSLPEQGFTPNGAQCLTYGGPPTPHDTYCPYRFILKWKTICPPAMTSCIRPQVQVLVTLETTINSTTTEAAYVTANNLNLAAFVPEVKMVAPAVTSGSLITNSDLYSVNSALLIDINAFVTAGLPVTVILPTPMTAKGGTVSASGSNITYTPAAGFYGLDSFNYSVTNATGAVVTGTLTIKVMTPHTWTGQGAMASVVDPLNWCGEVVSGACDHATFGATGLLGLDAHVVFDETCDTNCNANFNLVAGLKVRRFEMVSTYSGTVTITTLSIINGNGAGIARYTASADSMPDFDVSGGTLVANADMTIFGSARVASTLNSITLPPNMIVRSHKNPTGTQPPGAYTGVNLTVPTAKVTNYTASGWDGHLQLIGDTGQPELNVLNGFKIKTVTLASMNLAANNILIPRNVAVEKLFIGAAKASGLVLAKSDPTDLTPYQILIDKDIETIGYGMDISPGFELRLTGNQDGMIADKCSILLGRPACDPSVMTAPLYNVVINKTGGT